MAGARGTGLCLQLDGAGGTQGAFVGSLWHPSSAEHCQPGVDPTDWADRALGSHTSQHSLGQDKMLLQPQSPGKIHPWCFPVLATGGELRRFPLLGCVPSVQRSLPEQDAEGPARREQDTKPLSPGAGRMGSGGMWRNTLSHVPPPALEHPETQPCLQSGLAFPWDVWA